MARVLLDIAIICTDERIWERDGWAYLDAASGARRAAEEVFPPRAAERVELRRDLDTEGVPPWVLNSCRVTLVEPASFVGRRCITCGRTLRKHGRECSTCQSYRAKFRRSRPARLFRRGRGGGETMNTDAELVAVPVHSQWAGAKTVTVTGAIDTVDRTINPLMDRMEWDRMLPYLYEELRKLSQRPGTILIYESHDASCERAALTMELVPPDQEWRIGAAIHNAMAHECDHATWGVSCLLEGTTERSERRRRVRWSVVRDASLAKYMRGTY